MKKIILTLFVTLCLLLDVCPVTVQAQTSNSADILQELEQIDLEAYKNANTTALITLSENGFGTDKYELYIYVYYAEKQIISKSETSNLINIAIKFNDKHDAIEYANVNLKQIAKTENNSIYKFKILDDGNVLKNSTAQQYGIFGERKYDVASIQLLQAGARTAKDYTVGTSYIYSGLESSKTHKLNTLETIQLEVHPAWYRTQTSDKGKYYQNQLNSVYFAVPEKYFQDGYNLTAVKAEWYEYKTEPIVIINDNDVFNGLKSYVGKEIGDYDKNLKYHLSYGEEIYVDDAGGDVWYEWAYNVNTKFHYFNNPKPPTVKNQTTRLTYLFNTDGIIASNYTLPSQELMDYIYNYDKSFSKGRLDIKDKQISADLFQDNVDNGRIRGYNSLEISVDDTFDLLSYSDTHTWWDTVADYGLWNTIFGNIPADEASKRDVTPIYEVKPEDVIGDVKEKVLISNELVEEFKKYYNEQENKKTFMFRFANTDYKSAFLDYKDGYVSEETVFLDFDIIHLKFSNGNNKIVYSVVSNPVDVVPSITPPPIEDFTWLIYAISGVVLALVGIIIYNSMKGEDN